METTLEQAKKIIAKSIELGVAFEDEVPNSDSGIIELAEAILIDADNYPNSKASKELNNFADIVFSEKTSKSNTFLPKENLPIPRYVDIEDLPDMPVDLTTCTDEEIRRLHSVFNAYFVRTSYLTSEQEVEVVRVKQAHKQFLNKKLLTIDPFYREGNRAPKEKTKQIIEAEAYQDSKLVNALDKVIETEGILTKLKTLRDIYENNCTRLSRESSMRSAERI